MPTKGKDNNLIIYQTKSGALELRGDLEKETVWATQAQVATAFGVDVRTVNEHIQNIFKIKELNKKSSLRKFRIVQTEGKRTIERDINHYNLDMILSVGYRVNSRKATQFCQWATKTLQNITLHVKNIYKENELNKLSTCKKSLQIQKEGKREVLRTVQVY